MPFTWKNAPLLSAVFTLFWWCLFLAVGEENEMQFSYCFFFSTLCFLDFSPLPRHFYCKNPPSSFYAYTYIFSSTVNNTRKSFHTGKLSWMWRTRHTRQQFATIIYSAYSRTQRTSNRGEINRMFTSSRFAFSTLSLFCFFKSPCTLSFLLARHDDTMGHLFPE